MINVRITPNAQKAIKKLVKKNKALFEIILSEVNGIESNNNEGKGNFDGLSIHRFTFKSVRYRIIYNIEGDINTIYKIGTRENFYE
jgi:mRNA-degrading endonuclease RelE of RelBE toxin-antitoxin system